MKIACAITLPALTLPPKLQNYPNLLSNPYVQEMLGSGKLYEILKFNKEKLFISILKKV